MTIIRLWALIFCAPDQPATAQPVSEPFVSQAPAYDAGANVADMARPAPITPAVPGRAGNDDTNVRPVSPVTGMAAQPVGGGGNTNGRKPTFMYYVLLIALIVLSIFTLWLYQKRIMIQCQIWLQPQWSKNSRRMWRLFPPAKVHL